MARRALTYADAMTLWRAREDFWVERSLLRLLRFVLILEGLWLFLHGYFWRGMLILALQIGLLWCLGWGIGRLLYGAGWWLGYSSAACQAWWQRERSKCLDIE